jgi:hypothetical protein
LDKLETNVQKFGAVMSKKNKTGQNVEDLSLENQEKLSAKEKFILALCGAIIGFINGFFGGGGGMVCVPLLEKVLHLPNKYSHATAIVVILPISFVSAIIYMLSGNLETIPFLTVGSGVILGGIVGSYLLKFLPSKIVRIIFVFIMLAGGIRLLF